MRRIECTEGEPFLIDRRLAARLRQECARLQRELRPRFAIFSETATSLSVHGIVGTVELDAHTVLDIVPKTQPTDDWVSATLDLLIGTHRVDISGQRIAGQASHRPNLLEALASLYAFRLEHAVRREGPIVVMRRQHARQTSLKGKLAVSEWIRRAIWQPHVLPVGFNALTVDNEYSRTLSYVALLLSSMSRVDSTVERLRTAARSLRPGCAEITGSVDLVPQRQLPQQWMIYQPAWSLAISILTKRTLLGSRGKHHGFSIAVEAWPLLESLLARTISTTVAIGKRHNRALAVSPKSSFKVLSPYASSAAETKSVVPDGRLIEEDRTIATFEAKYKKRESSTTWPAREDIYQALVAAAATQSPIAVLVYPEHFDPIRWKVVGLQEQPVDLVAVGLGLFAYRRGAGDTARGQLIFDVINGTDTSASSAQHVA